MSGSETRCPIEEMNDLQKLSLSSSTSVLLLDALPNEIQDLIFHYVVLESSQDELKRFRQSNRYFQDRADIYLFRTLHVSASNRSLDRIKRISNHERLRAYVKELVFHRGTFSGHKMVRLPLRPRDYGDFEEYMVRGHRGYRPSQADLMRVSACYAAFQEEVEAESAFNREMSWQEDIRDYCTRFPKLEAITTLSQHNDIDSVYLKRRCGLTHQSWTPNYFAPYEIFRSCGPNFRPRSLNMASVNGEDFAAIIATITGGTPGIKDRFAELQYLNLGFSETVGQLETVGTYDVLVEAFTNLRVLSLDFESFFSPKLLKDPESFPQTFIKLVLRQRFSQLTELRLKYAMMTEADFITFLECHKSSLKSLNISRWPMPVTSGLSCTGSVTKALHKIGQVHFEKLQDITLKGEFSSHFSGEGCWIDPTVPEGSCVYARLHDYLMNKGTNLYPFPFAITETTLNEANDSAAYAALDELPHRLGYSDSSFTWWRALGTLV